MGEHDESTKEPTNQAAMQQLTPTQAILKEALESHELWLSTEGQQGKQADLWGMNLQGVNLQNANLENAKLRAVNLQQANLMDADLGGADLMQANLYKANLQGVKLQDTILFAADLHEAKLKEAKLERANLQRVNLQQTNLQGANLNKAFLRDANLWGADLQESNLEGANLQGANLQGANLQGANLQGANLKAAGFFEADLLDTNLADTDLREIFGAKFNSTIVRRARFSPRANDPWSVLRRNYTGPKFLFHLLFLVAFVLTYGATTMFYVGVNRAQHSLIQIEVELNAQIDRTVDGINDILKQLEHEERSRFYQDDSGLEKNKRKIPLEIIKVFTTQMCRTHGCMESSSSMERRTVVLAHCHCAFSL